MHRTTLSLDDNTWKKLRRYAAERGISVSALVTQAVASLFKHQPKKPYGGKLDWKAAAIGLKVDVQDRERMYELISRRF